MPEEKSVQRYMCGVKKQCGYLQPSMSPASQGRWVRHEHYALLQARLEEVEEHRTACEKALEEALAEFTSHAISDLPHIAYGYGKARDWLRRRVLRVHRSRRGSWVSPEDAASQDPERGED